MSPEGNVQYHIGVRLSMDEMGDWEPARIEAFFAGVARMLIAANATKPDEVEPIRPEETR